ncbi:hypothetical protein VTN00DRAFT_3198 [Thermoascus crustaceus]|uniref:uncharacterized protein n=1 Tax=Thermoascus crustaceus TaxID=5088 RepID=UPI0037447642
MAARTQATRLPATDLVRMGAIEKLTTRQDFETWSFLVTSMLGQFDLEDLIDSTIPRPAEDHPHHDRWSRLSKKVRCWLTLQIDSSIVRELRDESSTGWSIAYADETYEVIRRIIVGHAHTKAKSTWKSAIFMKREDYGSVEQYVTAFRQHVKAANLLKTPISPFCASLLLLEQLEKELPGWTGSIEAGFRSDIAETMTENEFHEICCAAIDEGNNDNADRSKPTSDKPRSSDPNGNTSSNLSSSSNGQTHIQKHRMAPPKGKSARQYVAEWRAHEPQRTPEGNYNYNIVR